MSQQTYTCQVCKQIFSSYLDFVFHVKSCTLYDDIPIDNNETENTGFKFDRQTKRRKFMRAHQKETVTNNCTETKNNQINQESKYNPTPQPKPYRYPCQFCTLTFPTNVEFMLHMRVHDSEKPIKCDKCVYSFSYNKQFSDHYYKVHGIHLQKEDRKKKICENSTFSNLNHSTDSFSSTLTLGDRKDFITEGEVPFSSADYKFSPDYIAKTFNIKKSTVNTTTATGPELAVITDNVEESYKSKVKKEATFQSDVTVNYTTKTDESVTVNQAIKLEVDSHEAVKEKYVCEASPNGIKPININGVTGNAVVEKRDIDVNKNNFRCKYCLKSFSTNWDYYLHTLVHDAEKQKHKCNKCDASFSEKHHLLEHKQKLLHYDIEYSKEFGINENFSEQYKSTFICTQCHLVFDTDLQLQEHRSKCLKQTLGLHKCDKCSEHFDDKTTFEKHRVCCLFEWYERNSTHTILTQDCSNAENGINAKIDCQDPIEVVNTEDGSVLVLLND